MSRIGTSAARCTLRSASRWIRIGAASANTSGPFSRKSSVSASLSRNLPHPCSRVNTLRISLSNDRAVCESQKGCGTFGAALPRSQHPIPYRSRPAL
eukprot:1374481-Rhodomonas_salina.2